MIRIFSIITLFMLLAFTATGHAAKRVALVIGNAAYKHAPLRNPLNDANDMASALKSLGFSVSLLRNVNHEAMERAIDAFGRDLTRSDIGIFYFAGHGAEVGGNNYLFPVNANVNNEADVKYRTVDAGYVLAEMEASGTKTNIVILDACRNNPFTRRFRSGSRGLAIMEAPIGSLIAFSTSPGKLAEDGAGRNGIYTKHLLNHIKTPGLTLRDVMLRTRIDVANETGRRQIPWDASSLMQKVFLAGPNGDAPQVALAPTPQAPRDTSPPKKPSKGDSWTEPYTGMQFIWVPGGCYMMGNPTGEAEEKPVHKVCLDGFWIGKYEVTQAEWSMLMSHNPSYTRGDSHPVDVTWQDAKLFIKSLNSRNEFNFRLPTEAEWEYAARSGGRNEIYSGGNDVDRFAQYTSPTHFNTHPVGTKEANGLGIHDMSGNVWEWCEDIYDDTAYSKHSLHNPVSRSGSTERVYRGGSSTNGAPSYVTTTIRDGIAPNFRNGSIGFRLAMTD